MDIARTILAVVIAFSLALLPAASGSVAGAETAGMAMAADTANDMSNVMDDCCPERGQPCAPASDQWAACCAHYSPIFAGAASSFDYPTGQGRILRPVAASALASQSGHPPFRPPRS